MCCVPAYWYLVPSQTGDLSRRKGEHSNAPSAGVGVPGTGTVCCISMLAGTWYWYPITHPLQEKSRTHERALWGDGTVLHQSIGQKSTPLSKRKAEHANAPSGGGRAVQVLVHQHTPPPPAVLCGQSVRQGLPIPRLPTKFPVYWRGRFGEDDACQAGCALWNQNLHNNKQMPRCSDTCTTGVLHFPARRTEEATQYRFTKETNSTFYPTVKTQLQVDQPSIVLQMHTEFYH